MHEQPEHRREDVRATVIEWDGVNLPEQLRHLPAGQYVLSPVGDIDDDELTDEEEAGILLALDQVEAGHGIPLDDVVRGIRRRHQRS